MDEENMRNVLEALDGELDGKLDGKKGRSFLVPDDTDTDSDKC